ncbi:MAG: DUF1993 domain-containing protein [Alphaproteobacteria bacterium]|nr:DUF1993 domain-containing protein [Alphaproteobacteria bacterium]
MSFSIHDAAVPPVLQILNAMSAILDKAARHCEARKIDPAVLLAFRLAPDMFPLTRQIQIMTDQAKGMAARLTGSEVPSWPDSETSIEELKARIARAATFVKGFTPAQFAGAEDRQIVLKVGGNEMNFTGRQYLVNFVFPNFYFHATTAYDILRHCGVEIGKRDFLGVA